MPYRTKAQTNSAAEAIDTIQQAAKETLGQAHEAAAEYYEEGVEQAKKLEATLEDYVKDNPIRSLLLAAGVSLGAGFLVGTLIRR